MISQLAERTPCSLLAARIPESRLVSIESDADRSIYRYSCGCMVRREVDTNDCLVRWCVEHRA